MKSQEQERKDNLEREGNSQGRLQRLMTVADHANERADRRLKATVEIV